MTLRDLPSGIVAPQAASASAAPSSEPVRANGFNLEHLERDHIERVLKTEAWNKARAARSLGISRRRLYRLLEKHHLIKSAQDGTADPT